MLEVQCICTCARAHLVFEMSQTGGADRVQILCVNREPLDKSFTHVWGEVHLHVRTCTPCFPDLANGWTNCVQILCVIRDPLDNCFPHVWGEVHLHVRTCTPLFHISRMARRIVFKFCVNSDKLDNCFAHVWCGVHLHVRTCIPLGGGTERRLVKLPATRTTNLRSAALPQKRCLAGNRRLVEHGDNNYSLELLFSLWETNLSYRNSNRRLVEHGDNNYSLELLFSLWETNLSYRNRALNKQLCWRLQQLATLLNPPPPGGGSDPTPPPPLGFSGITSLFITVSTWNLAHLSGHQFGVVSCKENQNRPKFFCCRSNFVTSLHAILGR